MRGITPPGFRGARLTLPDSRNAFEKPVLFAANTGNDRFVHSTPTFGADRRPRKYCPNSQANIAFRREHPREYGIVVYATSSAPEESPEVEWAEALGRELGELTRNGKRMHVVTGGGNSAMRAVARGAESVGAHTAGITLLYDGEKPDPGHYREYVIQNTIADRLDGIGGFEHRGAYSVALPGGPGTFHEIFKKAEELYYNSTPYPSQRQIILCDVDGFYTAPGGLLDLVEHLARRNKVRRPDAFRNLFKIARTPQEAAALLLNPDIPWTKGSKGTS